MAAGQVEYHEAGLGRSPPKPAREVGEANGIQGNVGIASDFGTRRHEIILAFKLETIAGEINRCHRLRASGGDFVEKFTKRRAQGLAIQVARPNDIESRRL